MTGFIRGLFGGKKQPRPPKQKQDGSAFFLDEDEARTFGDINYMRSSKVVKRTFARKKGQTEELESIRQISAMEKADLRENGLPTPPPTQSSFSTKLPEPEPPKRRSDDDGMDMFRNMAKDLKKRG